MLKGLKNMLPTYVTTKLNSLDDRKNFQFFKSGIGIKSEQYAKKSEIKKYENKLKVGFSDHKTKGDAKN